jgi:transcriptional regulator with XRE-family HTH domain
MAEKSKLSGINLESLRKAIRDSCLSAKKIEKATGLPRSTIARFLAETDLSLSTAKKLATFLANGREPPAPTIHIAEALRAAIRDSGHSADAIAEATSVSQSTVTRFMQGRDIRLSRAAKIAVHLGLEVTLRPSKASRASKPKRSIARPISHRKS